MKLSVFAFLFIGFLFEGALAQESIDLNLALRHKDCDMDSSGQTHCAEKMSPALATHIILNKAQGSSVYGQASILGTGPGFNSEGIIYVLKAMQPSGEAAYSIRAAMGLEKTGIPIQLTEQGSSYIGKSLQDWQPGTGQSYGGEQYYLTRTRYIVASLVVWKSKALRFRR